MGISTILLALVVLLLAIAAFKLLFGIMRTVAIAGLLLFGAYLVFKFGGGPETIGAAISTGKQAINETVQNITRKLPF